MSSSDSQDEAALADAMAETADSDSRPAVAVADAMADTFDSGSRPQTRPGADSGADTLVADEDEQRTASSTTRPPHPEDDNDDLIGITLSERYEVTAKLGQGGMGAVYEARHTVIGKRVALKVLLDKHAENDQSVARLKQEARLASSIGHENIIDITDFGTTDTGRTFVVMEYLEGESLGSLISRESQLDSPRAIHIARQIASALAAAHAKGIVHRDIKPENIFVLRKKGEDFIKVLDFGISKSLDPDDEDVRLTQTGMVLGTPLYMSPEQAQGDDDLDHRIDVYALGVILYESITGEVPFHGKNYLNILTQVISDEPKPISEYVPDVDRNLESVIYKAMSKEREDRYQSMDEFAADLAALDLIDPKSTSAKITAARWRRKRNGRSKSSYAAWLGGVALVAGGSVVAVTMLMGGGPKAGEDKQALAAVVAFDAAPKVVPADATPAFMEAHIKLESTPLGAKVFEGVRETCDTTPCVYDAPKTGGQIILKVVHEGYQDGFLTITPELDDGDTVTITLLPIPKKTEKNGRRPRHRNNKKPPKNTPDPSNGKTTSGGGSDTIDNPF